MRLRRPLAVAIVAVAFAELAQQERECPEPAVCEAPSPGADSHTHEEAPTPAIRPIVIEYTTSASASTAADFKKFNELFR
jgi:hypothetical protein